MNKKVRLAAGAVIVVVTVAAFSYYVAHHTYLIHHLLQTSPVTIGLLLLLYGAWFGALALVLQAQLRICQRAMGIKENLLLNAYSSLVNFFVPGQGGPVVRGAYLKKRHRLRVRDYFFVTLLYYGCYALTSALLLLVGSRPWWQTVVVLFGVGGASFGVLRWYGRRKLGREDAFDLGPRAVGGLVLVTVVQAVVQIAIYAVELHTVNGHIALWQAVTYTGAANFALFVAITPGAIGIRESFLLFSERLHHISSANVVAASVLDRAVFILFLACLLAITLGLHTRDRFRMGASDTTKT